MSASRSAALFPWRCSGCRQPRLTQTFVTTIPRHSAEAPTTSTSTPASPPSTRSSDAPITPGPSPRPESPRYIRIPQSAQPTISKPQWPKGTLPVPRDIFASNRGGLDKASPAYLNRVYPARQKPPGASTKVQASVNSWCMSMAEMRRRNLKEGLAALARRKLRRRAISRQKSLQRAGERRELVTQPPREADRLTRPSVTEEIMAPLNKTGYLRHVNAEERQKVRVATYEAHRARKAADTQDALHTLFMRARNFIVTESQLDKAIDEAFGTDKDPTHFGAKRAPSVWGNGPPPGLRDMLERAGQAGGGTRSSEHNDSRERLMQERLQKVAESLTGGKM